MTFSNHRYRYPRIHKNLQADENQVRKDLLEAYFNVFKVEIVDTFLKFAEDNSEVFRGTPEDDSIICSRFREYEKDIIDQPNILEKIYIYERFFDKTRKDALDWCEEIWDNIDDPEIFSPLCKITLNICNISLEVEKSKIDNCCSRCRRCGLDTECDCRTIKYRRNGWVDFTKHMWMLNHFASAMKSDPTNCQRWPMVADILPNF